jgi:hypothetical protein
MMRAARLAKQALVIATALAVVLSAGLFGHDKVTPVRPRGYPLPAGSTSGDRGLARWDSADPHPPSYFYPIYAGFLMGIVAVGGAVAAAVWFLARLLLR